MKLLFIVALIAGSAGHSLAQSTTWITGTIDHFDKDSVVVTILEDAVTRQSQVKKVAVTQGRFYVQATIAQPCLLSISDGEFYVNGMADAGDSLVVRFDAGQPRTTVLAQGKGREAFLLMNSLSNNKISAMVSGALADAKSKAYPIDYLHKLIDSSEQYYLRQLAAIRPAIGSGAAQLLEGEIKGALLYKRYNAIGLLYSESAVQILANLKGSLTPVTEKYLRNPISLDGAYAMSGTYINNAKTLIGMHYDALMMAGERLPTRINKYRYADSVLPAALRMPVLTLFLLGDIRLPLTREEFGILEQLVYRARDEGGYRRFANRKFDESMAIYAGMPAPDFVVENEKGQAVRLSDLKGKTVYVDFWFSACGPCHALFKTIAPVKQHFRNNGKVVFLTVSVDNKITWKKALQQFGIAGYHVYTQDRERAHPMVKDYGVDGYPTTLLIGPDGKIAVARPAHTASELIAQIESALSQ